MATAKRRGLRRGGFSVAASRLLVSDGLNFAFEHSIQGTPPGIGVVLPRRSRLVRLQLIERQVELLKSRQRVE
jgi:hypothetical protein